MLLVQLQDAKQLRQLGRAERSRLADFVTSSGLDALTVSMLMGHADPSMVARVYSHLNHAPDYLLKAVERAGARQPRCKNVTVGDA